MKYLTSALFGLFATNTIAYPWYGHREHCVMPYPKVIMINPKIKIKAKKNIKLPKSESQKRSWGCGASTGWEL